MVYRPPLRDYRFLFRDVLKLDDYAVVPKIGEVPLDLVEQVIEAAGEFAAGVLAPLNMQGDKAGCQMDGDRVITPPGFKEAYRQLVEGGWPALSVDPQWGGQGLPYVVSVAFMEMSSSANMAFSMYPGLTRGALAALEFGGSDSLKALYLPKLASGEWAGTMSLTESHCGTDLGMLRTKAVHQADGTYRLSGQKIWISGGEQDFTDNILHLVLARIEGAPAGVKGISLFAVPKFIPNPDGSIGARNGVKCVGLEEKMGIHGSSTCVIQHQESTGWLIGAENSGLKIMFVMMNEARLGVAVQGLSQAEAANQAAADFARERLQGRSLTGAKNQGGLADPIVVHPDVRRLLMDSRALIEGGRAFMLWTALHADLARGHPDEAIRQKANDYMGLLTPVLKAYLTDRGFKAANDALQVHGGAGFTEHFPASQYVRDSRITMIYEGTNGVQALDLVGRKLAANGGRAVMTFFAEIDGYVGAAGRDPALQPFVDGLAGTKAQLQEATLWLMQNGMANPDNAGAASTDYLHLFGLTGLAYMWALEAEAAQAKVAAGDEDSFYTNKLITGRYFLERMLPDAAAHLVKLKAGSGAMMDLSAEAF